MAVKDVRRSPLVIIAVVGLLVLGAAGFFLLRNDDSPAGTSAGRPANAPPSTSELGTIAFPDDANIIDLAKSEYEIRNEIDRRQNVDRGHNRNQGLHPRRNSIVAKQTPRKPEPLEPAQVVYNWS